MNKSVHTKNNAASPTEDVSVTLNKLIRLTQNLSHLADREAKALAQNDMLSFAILQDEKTLVAEQYISASEDFRLNINTYRGAERDLLDRLEKLQQELGEKTSHNNTTVNHIYNRAQARTQSSLLAAQELGQDQRIRYPHPSQAVNENTQKAGE